MTIVLKRLLFITLTGVSALPLVAAFRLPNSEVVGQVDREVAEPVAATPSQLVVEVIGRDFRWHFRCLEPAGWPVDAADAATLEELHLPTGARVEFRFTSDDYIYLCKIPEIGISQIAVPGLTHECVREVTEPGTYDMRVDPLCSFRFYHDELMGRIVVDKDLRIVPLSEST
jgi:heme/copper-type cytochrome/quinol oxidase subunit 2